MSVELHAVQALRVWSESTFATDGTGTLANYTYVPAREGSASMELMIDSIDPQQNVQSRLEYREEVLGKRSAKLTFTVNLAPTGTAAASGVSAVTGALGTLLKACMGGESKGAGTTFTGGTATIPIVTSSAAIAAGNVIGWTNASSIVEWREVESVSGTSVTLKHAFSAAPSNGNVCYNAATYYLTENPSESLQFIVEGYESDDRWLLMGGQAVGGVTFAFDPSGASLPSVTFSMQFATFKYASETSGTITGTLGSATYSNYEPIVGHAGEYRCFTVGASTLSTSSRVHVSALAFTPKIAFVPVTSPSGTMTIKQWRGGRMSPPVEGSFTTFFEDATWFTARDSKADRAITYTMGTAAGSSVVVTAPTVQIVNPQRAADASQIAAVTVPWKGRRDSDVASSTTELSKSAFRVHLG